MKDQGGSAKNLSLKGSAEYRKCLVLKKKIKKIWGIVKICGEERENCQASNR